MKLRFFSTCKVAKAASKNTDLSTFTLIRKPCFFSDMYSQAYAGQLRLRRASANRVREEFGLSDTDPGIVVAKAEEGS